MTSAATVFRDFFTDGVSGSGIWSVQKADTRAWGTSLELQIAALQALAQRNLLFNSAMEVSQEVEGAAVTGSSTGVFPVDMFRFAVVTGGTLVATAQRVTSSMPAGYRNALKVTVTTAQAVVGSGDATSLAQRIEGLRFARLAYGGASARTVMLAFWVRSSLIGTYSVALRNNANDRTYIASYTINTADTWEYKRISITGDQTGTWLTDTGIGLRVLWGLVVATNLQAAAGSWTAGNYSGAPAQANLGATIGNTWYMTGAVLIDTDQVIPDVNSPQLILSFPEELRRCQREYQKSFPIGVAPVQNVGNGLGALGGSQAAGASVATVILGTVFLQEPSRTASYTVTTYNISAANAQIHNTAVNADWTSTGIGSKGEKSFTIFGTTPGGSAAGDASAVHWTVNDRL